MAALGVHANRVEAGFPFTTHVIGRVRLYYGEVPSTNAVLARLARTGAVEGTVVVAETQRDARGQDGGRAFCPPDVNFYGSVLFRPRLPAGRVGLFGAQVAQVLVDALRLEGVAAEARWPDRVVVAGKTLGTVVCEASPAGGPPDYVLVGVAVNLNVTPDALRAGLGQHASDVTSVATVLGREVDRLAFGNAVVALLDDWYARFRAEGLPPVIVGGGPDA